MHLHFPSDLCDLVRKVGPGCYLYSTYVARAYRQHPLDPADWPLVCVTFRRGFYSDISLPLGMCWAVSHCQDIRNMISR